MKRELHAIHANINHRVYDSSLIEDVLRRGKKGGRERRGAMNLHLDAPNSYWEQ